MGGGGVGQDGFWLVLGCWLEDGVFDMKKYFVWMIIVGATVCALWYVFSCWLMSFSDDHDWMSSFVEIAFALNGAITFEKIRGYITPLRGIFDKKLNEFEKQYKGSKVQNKVLSYVKAHTSMLFEQFEEKAGRMLNWIVNIARVACFMCVVVLFVHNGGDKVVYIPALLFPCIFYGLGNMFLMFMIADDMCGLFNEALENCGVQVS